MTVSELIEELKKYPKDWIVTLDNHDDPTTFNFLDPSTETDKKGNEVDVLMFYV